VKALAQLLAYVGVMLIASELLTRGLENIGARLRFTEGLLGLATALGANAPEVSSATAALWSGHQDLGLGVVLGSNVFNLAGLLGVSAVVAGRVSIGREGLLLNGAIALVVTSVIVALLFGFVSPTVSVVLLALLIAPYLALLTRRPPQIAQLKLRPSVSRFLTAAIGHAHRDARKRKGTRPGGWRDVLVVLVALVVIVACSVGAVHSAVTLAGRWELHHAVMGTLILAAVTSIPNVVAAVKLAREARGAAVVSEAINSNTLNALAGICLPALVLGVGAVSGQTIFTAAWLLGMTAIAIVAAGRPRGLSRLGGLILIGLYLVFAALVAIWR
jgi:cation:H+ antiporter